MQCSHTISKDEQTGIAIFEIDMKVIVSSTILLCTNQYLTSTQAFLLHPSFRVGQHFHQHGNTNVNPLVATAASKSLIETPSTPDSETRDDANNETIVNIDAAQQIDDDIGENSSVAVLESNVESPSLQSNKRQNNNKANQSPLFQQTTLQEQDLIEESDQGIKANTPAPDTGTKKSWRGDWGAFLLNRKNMEEQVLKDQEDITEPIQDITSSSIIDEPEVSDTNRTEINQKIDLGVEIEPPTQSPIEEVEESINEVEAELDESVTLLPGIQMGSALKDMEVLPVSSSSLSAYGLTNAEPDSNLNISSSLPLGDPEHTERIERDMQLLAVSVASTIDTTEQYKLFVENGGGLKPLLQTIRDGAREIRQGELESNFYTETVLGTVELQEEALVSACTACRTLRDLCAISKPFAVVMTDGILQADASWSEPVMNKKKKKIFTSGGILSDFLTLLRHTRDFDRIYNRQRKRERLKKLRNGGFPLRRYRRQSRGKSKSSSNPQFQNDICLLLTLYLACFRLKEARKRCCLYVTQLLLEMAFASDDAVHAFRNTSGLTETIVSISSYAPRERLRRRWIRYPIEVVRRKISGQKEILDDQRPFLAAASISDGIDGQIQGASNQLLAAIGHNIWYPKSVNQKGLRILCLDGGGTRGIAAISTMSSIVDALGGVEVCDAFDIIAGTSTGAIIAFLVGLRRESSVLAKKRYDKLIKRIFVKSALSTPMLLFTTATYDEAPFNSVMAEILQDNSMLASRADPRVPLVFAISSKMTSTPTQLCLFRNYNYKSGEIKDTFVQDPNEAREELGLEPTNQSPLGSSTIDDDLGFASRHPGTFTCDHLLHFFRII